MHSVHCPACGHELDLREITAARFTCSNCQTELTIGLQRKWIYGVVSFLAALAIAEASGLRNIIFVVGVIVLAAVIDVALLSIAITLGFPIKAIKAGSPFHGLNRNRRK